LESYEPELAIAALNELFTRFDRLMRLHNASLFLYITGKFDIIVPLLEKYRKTFNSGALSKEVGHREEADKILDYSLKATFHRVDLDSDFQTV
jgi:hypothetical protein